MHLYVQIMTAQETDNMESVINKNCQIDMHDIAGLKFVIADNFLNDPESFRRYAKALSTMPTARVDNRLGYELRPPVDEFEARYPGFRQDLINFMISTIATSTKNAYGLDDSFTSLGIYKGPLFNCVYQLPFFGPHVDSGHISSFIYLNTEEQCSGGTGIYRHMPSGKTRLVQQDISVANLERQPLTRPLNYSTGEWELLHKFEMHYNRLIAFTSSVIHKIFFEPEGHPYREDIDHVRLCLNSFFLITRPNQQAPGI